MRSGTAEYGNKDPNYQIMVGQSYQAEERPDAPKQTTMTESMLKLLNTLKECSGKVEAMEFKLSGPSELDAQKEGEPATICDVLYRVNREAETLAGRLSALNSVL